MIDMSTVVLSTAMLLLTISVGITCFEWQCKVLHKNNRLKLRGRLLSTIAPKDGEDLSAAVLTFGRNQVSALAKNINNRSEPLRWIARRRHEKQLHNSYAQDFPALLDVVALGMRAGMSFDKAFELYACRFTTPLAVACGESAEAWRRGLISREESMCELSKRIDMPFFSRFTAATLRAIKFGSPMTQMLTDLAQEARREYRASQQERVAKAPVKMLIPTGTLILPAMLLLVMGPIVLDLMKRMV